MQLYSDTVLKKYITEIYVAEMTLINLEELKNHDLDEYSINYSINRHKETLINFI